MTTTKPAIPAIICLALALALAAPSWTHGATMGVSAGHDLDALWARARATHDLAARDAVLLLESRTVTVDAAGGLATRVHRVVWIGTARGIGAYADLRVPWRQDTQTFTVEILRTWRDGRWWPDPERISDTAVVHTLPHAVADAHDYTARRETMLLHDGVELPCIMETAYTIAGPAPVAGGASDLFVIPQADPAVLTEYAVRAPDGVALAHRSLGGAPAPAVARGDGWSAWTWTIEGAPALGWPATDRPHRHEPAILWTTWDDRGWARAWAAAFDAAAVAGEELAAAARDRLDKAAGLHDEAAQAVAFAAAAIRPIRDADPWRLAPRPADRVWATAYGTALDRAVVLAAVLRAHGHQVAPLLLADLPSDPDGVLAPAMAAAAAAAVGDLCLLVAGPDGQARLIDVAAGAVHGRDHRPGAARLALAPPFALEPGRQDPGRLEVALWLEPDEDGGWSGRGEVRGRGALGLQEAILTHEGGLDGLAARLVAGVLEGATATGAAPRRLDREAGALAFALTLPAEDGEQAERGDGRRLVVGAPAGGLRDHLPRDVHLADARRSAPVLLGAPLAQRLDLRLRVPEDRVLHTPAPGRLAGEAGAFTVTVAREGDWLHYARELTLDRAVVAAEAWPDLRALLLEEVDPANGTIVLFRKEASAR